LTPSLIDKDAAGDPAQAGNAYALNVLGCILGPLFASYVLLPWVGERYGLVLLSLPFLGFFLLTSKSLPSLYRMPSGAIAGGALVYSLFFPVDFGTAISRTSYPVEIRRDYAASVISSGTKLDKHLFVNGIGVTTLTPETKFMAHLPLALHAGKPESMLIICFRGANGTGVHILASMEPIQERTPSQVASAMPPAAARDLLEWNPSGNLPEYLGRVLSARFVTAKLLIEIPTFG